MAEKQPISENENISSEYLFIKSLFESKFDKKLKSYPIYDSTKRETVFRSKKLEMSRTIGYGDKVESLRINITLDNANNYIVSFLDQQKNNKLEFGKEVVREISESKRILDKENKIDKKEIEKAMSLLKIFKYSSRANYRSSVIVNI